MSRPRKKAPFDTVDELAAAIASRVRAETDAEWRARVEGMKAALGPQPDARHDDRLRYAWAGKVSALDALLTAVARDREGQ